MQCGNKDIRSFLFFKSTNESDHRNAPINRQPHFCLKRFLRQWLCIHNLRKRVFLVRDPTQEQYKSNYLNSYSGNIIVIFKVFVCRWVPLLSVHAIYDASDGMSTEDVIQLYSFIRTRNKFFRVVWAHSQNSV